MAYTNSPLVSYTKFSPNHSGQRNHSIDRITPHCVVGQCSVETLGEIFYPTSRQASSNYGIGVDGRVAMYVEEKNRSWCSSSGANDHRAITIECASDTTEPYAFKDIVYQTLIIEMIEVEREKAKAAFSLIKAHPEAVEEMLTPLRAEATELFSRMEAADDETEMEKLSARFNFLTDEEQKIRYAYSLQNPWMLNFMQLGTVLTHEAAIAAIDHIKVQADITDQDWLRSPIYPSAGKYNKGMSTVIGVESPGTEVDREKDGRKKRRVKNLIYREPELEITGINAIPRFYQYRDYLPERWLEPRTSEEKAEVASARKEAERWVQEQQDGMHVPCYRKRRKNRNC